MPIAAGLHYFLHEGGSALNPSLVLIHGAGGDHLSWPPEIRRLPGFRVFTLDLPGHGKTEKPGLQSAWDYARQVAEFSAAVGLARAVYVGHDMGGAIALALALDFPNRAAGIGLIAAGPRLPIASSILENVSTQSTFPQAVEAFHALTLGPQTPAALSETTFARLAAARQTLLYGDLLACDQFDATGRLEAVGAPTLVVCGTDDKLTPVRFSETLASRIPGAALQTIDGAGHMVMLEQPRRLAKLLSVFLAMLSYQPGM